MTSPASVSRRTGSVLLVDPAGGATPTVGRLRRPVRSARTGHPARQARRRAVSYSTMPAATPAFSDSAPPGIGIRTR